MPEAHDDETIAFYDREAIPYAARGKRSRDLDTFIARLAPGAKILELGCGAGRDAEALIQAGFDVTPTDASQGLAAIASERIGRPVRIMRFDELDARDAYDGVWAHACLLHAPFEALPDILAKIRTALRPGGVFFANFKAGEGGDRDTLGRYYNFPTRDALEHAYAAAGPWKSLSFEEGTGGGYDGVARAWFACTATK